jgi:hypothetical protein
MLFQIVSLVGAILMLSAFAAHQLERLATQTKTYQMLNLIGGFLTFVAAVAAKQYGFILLEGTWTVASAYGLWRLSR